MSGYVHAHALVDTSWVADHLHDPRVRLVECNEDVLLYRQGHIPGAVTIDCRSALIDPLQRDYLEHRQFARLVSNLGIANDTTVVLYGDQAGWWAAHALWVFKLFGHQDVRILNGGRAAWIAEERPLTRAIPVYQPTGYRSPQRNDTEIRAFHDQVLEHIRNSGTILVDVRSPQEYSGELTHAPEYPDEGALRAGHIPTAVNIPWGETVAADGRFKPYAELRALYEHQGVTADKEIITYCRIGERSSHTWFVLTSLLGYRHVRNYDGSWTEWGNLVGAPIARTYQPPVLEEELVTAAWI
jgi:thiosulfate/3-mercaptopyruvate sulfurtransferase